MKTNLFTILFALLLVTLISCKGNKETEVTPEVQNQALDEIEKQTQEMKGNLPFSIEQNLDIVDVQFDRSQKEVMYVLRFTDLKFVDLSRDEILKMKEGYCDNVIQTIKNGEDMDEFKKMMKDGDLEVIYNYHDVDDNPLWLCQVNYKKIK